MNQQNSSFRSGLVIGAIFGVVLAGVGLAHSAVGKKAWDTYGRWFQAGYVNGFLDAVRLSKSQDPHGWIDKTYTLPKGAKSPAWQKEIETLYEDPKFADSDVPRLIIVAGKRLEKVYGPEEGKDPNAGLQRLGAAIQEFKKKQREAKAAKEAAEKAGGDTAKKDSGDEAKAPDSAKDEKATEDSGSKAGDSNDPALKQDAADE